MPKVTVKIEGGGEVDLLGGHAQDVIELLLGKGVDEVDLKTPGVSTEIGGKP